MIIAYIKRWDKKEQPFTPAYAFYHHRDLYQAAVRHFGSWRKALKAAGLGKGLKRERRWNRNKVLAEIRKYDNRKIPLNYTSIARRTRRLTQAAIRYFGSWENAVTQAGFNYKKIKWQSVTGRHLKI